MDVESLINIGDTCRRFQALTLHIDHIFRDILYTEAPWIHLGVDGIEHDNWHQCARFVVKNLRAARIDEDIDIHDILWMTLEEYTLAEETIETVPLSTVDRLPADFEPIFGKTTVEFETPNIEIDMKTLQLKRVPVLDNQTDVYDITGFPSESPFYKNEVGVLIFNERKGVFVPWKNGLLDGDNLWALTIGEEILQIEVIPKMFFARVGDDREKTIYYIDVFNQKCLPILPWFSHQVPSFAVFPYRGYLWIGNDGHLVPMFLNTSTGKIWISIYTRALVGCSEEFDGHEQGSGKFKRYLCSQSRGNGVFYDLATGTILQRDEQELDTGIFYAGFSQRKLQYFRISPDRLDSINNQILNHNLDFTGLVIQ